MAYSLSATLTLASWCFLLSQAQIALYTKNNIVALVYHDSNTTVLDCQLYGDRSALQMIKLKNPKLLEQNNSTIFDAIVAQCHQFDRDNITRAYQTKARQSKFSWGRELMRAIYPGTKWCGMGNIATGFHDLGRLEELDKCCRKHDHCDTFIPSLTSKYGLFNNALYTTSDCQCDKEFRDCLCNLKSKPAMEVCEMFFNTLDMDCIHLSTNETCQEYFFGLWSRCHPAGYVFYDQPSC